VRFTTVPIDPLPDVLARRPDTVWMSGDLGLWGWGEVARFHPGSGEDRAERIIAGYRHLLEGSSLRDEVETAGAGPVLFASLTFSPRSSGSVGVVPATLVGRRGQRWWMTRSGDAPLPQPQSWGSRRDRARYAGSSAPDHLWLGAVVECLRRISSGEVDKVVLARDYAVWSRQPFVEGALLDYLSRRFPACHVFSVDGLVGASPELLIRRRRSGLTSLVLAGSAPRHPDPTTDRRRGEELVRSPKERLEHELAVRSVREALEPLTSHLEFDAHPRLLRLDNVQHLATGVRARLATELDALTVAAHLHPTAAVGGYPTAAALDLIAELEGMDRARYAGPVGWMDAAGDGEFAIALRCAEVSGARARLFAGAGIVAGSLPEAELEETRLKLAAMMGALGAD
jgi:menaquinone-specific isochorismate synthase